MKDKNDSPRSLKMKNPRRDPKDQRRGFRIKRVDETSRLLLHYLAAILDVEAGSESIKAVTHVAAVEVIDLAVGGGNGVDCGDAGSDNV